MLSPPPDRIRELCARALTAQSPELEEIMNELREAIKHQIAFTKAMAFHVLEHVEADPTEDGKRRGSWRKAA